MYHESMIKPRNSVDVLLSTGKKIQEAVNITTPTFDRDSCRKNMQRRKYEFRMGKTYIFGFTIMYYFVTFTLEATHELAQLGGAFPFV